MTPEERSFLDAILADPADDTVRLVYADWLEEHGRPERAEFIRLQVKLGVWCNMYPQEKGLLDTYRTVWLGGMKCKACGGKGSGWQPKEPSRYKAAWTCDFCRGTGWQCWPLVRSMRRVDRSEDVDYIFPLVRSMRRVDRSEDVDYIFDIESTFTRGFVSKIELTCEQFVAPGVAKTIFQWHPVTEVSLLGLSVHHGFVTLPNTITGMFDPISDTCNFAPEEANRLCVAWGREQAGLTPIPMPAGQSRPDAG